MIPLASCTWDAVQTCCFCGIWNMCFSDWLLRILACPASSQRERYGNQLLNSRTTCIQISSKEVFQPVIRFQNQHESTKSDLRQTQNIFWMEDLNIYITGWLDILQSHIPLQCHFAKYSALVAPNIRRLCQPKLEHPTMWHRRPVGWLTSRFEEPLLIYFATWLTGFPTSRSQVLQGNYDHSCDIWSCGVIMWRAQWIGNEALLGPVYLRMIGYNGCNKT